MIFFSVYNALISPASNWCDNLYDNSLSRESSKNSSLLGQMEAEVLGRFVCLGTIATGTILIPVDIVLTALVGVGAFACAVAQTYGLHARFNVWRNSTEKEVAFLAMTISSEVSLLRSVYWNTEPATEPRSSLYKLRQFSDHRTQEKFAKLPIYSRTSAIGQLFFSAPLAKTGWFAVGCLSVLFNGITLGYFRKKFKGALTFRSSLFLLAPISLAFHTISCFIHLAKPATKHLKSTFLLQDEKAHHAFEVDTEVNASSVNKKAVFLQPYYSTYSTNPTPTQIAWSVFCGSPLVAAVVLISQGTNGAFAVKEEQIVLARIEQEKISDEQPVTKYILKNGHEVPLHEAMGYLISEDPNYAVLGSDKDGNFTLDGSCKLLNRNESTMCRVPVDHTLAYQE